MKFPSSSLHLMTLHAWLNHGKVHKFKSLSVLSYVTRVPVFVTKVPYDVTKVPDLVTKVPFTSCKSALFYKSSLCSLQKFPKMLQKCPFSVTKE